MIPASALPDCPQCGTTIRQAERVGVSACVAPCEHFIPADFFKPSHVEAGVSKELVADGGRPVTRILDESDIVVARPIPRETVRATERGFLATCYDTQCDWQGLFPAPDLAAAACERHWDHEQRSGEWHYGRRNYTVIELLNEATAYTLDQSELGLSVEEIRLGTADGGVREVEFPRTTGDVSELVERGDRIITPPDREQKVRGVTESRSHGLPTWSVGFCDVEDDLLSGNLPPRGQNELIARDGKIHSSFGPDPFAAPAFEVVGETEHQADFTEFAGGSA